MSFVTGSLRSLLQKKKYYLMDRENENPNMPFEHECVLATLWPQERCHSARLCVIVSSCQLCYRASEISRPLERLHPKQAELTVVPLWCTQTWWLFMPPHRDLSSCGFRRQDSDARLAAAASVSHSQSGSTALLLVYSVVSAFSSQAQVSLRVKLRRTISADEWARKMLQQNLHFNVNLQIQNLQVRIH